MPQLNLVLGANINPNSIIEGSDVYTECHIRSNPPVYEVTWLFEGEPLYSDRSKGIIIANQTLVLQRIKKTSRGNYQCIGRNEIGIGKSNPLFLRVQCKFPSSALEGKNIFPVELICRPILLQLILRAHTAQPPSLLQKRVTLVLDIATASSEKPLPSGRNSLVQGGSCNSQLAHTIHNAQYTVHSTQYTVHSTQYTVQNTLVKDGGWKEWIEDADCRIQFAAGRFSSSPSCACSSSSFLSLCFAFSFSICLADAGAVDVCLVFISFLNFRSTLALRFAGLFFPFDLSFLFLLFSLPLFICLFLSSCYISCFKLQVVLFSLEAAFLSFSTGKAKLLVTQLTTHNSQLTTHNSLLTTH